MDTERYVCIGCRRAWPEPGLCPGCGHSDLLDMKIPSERELLADTAVKRANLWKGGALLLLVLGGLVLLSGIGALALERYLGIPIHTAFFLSSQAAWMLLFVSSVLLGGRRKKPSTEQEDALSEHDPVSWEVLLDEPVAAEQEAREEARKREAARMSRQRER